MIEDTFKERFEEAIRKDTSAILGALSNENPNRFCESCFAEPRFDVIDYKILLKYLNTQHREKLTNANQALLDEMLLGRKQNPNVQPVLSTENIQPALPKKEDVVRSPRLHRFPFSSSDTLRIEATIRNADRYGRFK
ncbi:MAG TPA: hypothetical protein VGV92_07275 [Gammaproteobacteria bacterium]|nr:hypothetical protein [Gammaproteobacteria bacterium]